MPSKPKILLLDDDQELLDMYREILAQMPSRPEVHTAASGARAIALLEAQPFTLMITDLNMPKMDGLQVLSIVRRKFPKLRIVVLTSVMDEQFRSRSYAMGVDLFWQKPSSMEEIKLFLDCIESLLGQEEKSGGFRGVQSKSLMDLIQLECLSNSSTVLHITNGPLDGKIWIQDGNVIDAATKIRKGQEAFQDILSWRTGNFEILPFDEGHERTIFDSIHGLLLETAQAIDEGRIPAEDDSTDEDSPAVSAMAAIGKSTGVEFLILAPKHKDAKTDSWAAENVSATTDWILSACNGFTSVGDTMQAGQLQTIECHGAQGHTTISVRDDFYLCAGWNRNMSADQVRERLIHLNNEWDSLDSDQTPQS